LAELLGVTQACKDLSDGHLSAIIADMVATELKGRESLLESVLRDVVGDFFVANDLSPGPHYWRVVRFWSNLFVAGLLDEMDRREKINDRKGFGRKITELIVEEDRRDKLLQKLGKQVAEWRSFTGECPEPSEDAQSEACNKIWEQVRSFTSCEPPAANPYFLYATITGAFKKILLHARDHLWSIRKREREEAKKLFALDDRPTEPKGGNPSGVIPLQSIPPNGRLNRSEERLATKLLVDQVLRHLEDDERKVVTLVEVEGRTQAEVAKKLKISQPTVSRLWESAMEKLRNYIS
jgi:RNA polymerase sigma factor (sigma-70 family)